MRYAVVLTKVRPADQRRDERTHPEWVICRCEFDQWRTADLTAREWARQPHVRAGWERVKIVTGPSPRQTVARSQPGQDTAVIPRGTGGEGR